MKHPRDCSLVIQSNSHGVVHVCASEILGLLNKVAASQLPVESDLWPLLTTKLYRKSSGRMARAKNISNNFTI